MQRALRFAATQIVGDEPVFKNPIAEVNDHFTGTATAPVTAGVVVDAAQAQDLKVLVERVTVAIEADERSDRNSFDKTRMALPVAAFVIWLPLSPKVETETLDTVCYANVIKTR